MIIPPMMKTLAERERLVISRSLQAVSNPVELLEAGHLSSCQRLKTKLRG
jgi:hypothetical protein